MDVELLLSTIVLYGTPIVMTIGLAIHSFHQARRYNPILVSWLRRNQIDDPVRVGVSEFSLPGASVTMNLKGTQFLEVVASTRAHIGVAFEVRNHEPREWDHVAPNTRNNILLLDARTRAAIDRIRNVQDTSAHLVVQGSRLRLHLELNRVVGKHETLKLDPEDLDTALRTFDTCLEGLRRLSTPAAPETLARRAREDPNIVWRLRALRILLQEHLETSAAQETLAWALTNENSLMRELACAYGDDEVALPIWHEMNDDVLELGALRARELAHTYAGPPPLEAYALLYETHGAPLLLREDIPEAARAALLAEHISKSSDAGAQLVFEALAGMSSAVRAFFLEGLFMYRQIPSEEVLLTLLPKLEEQELTPMRAHLTKATLPKTHALAMLEVTRNPFTLVALGAYFEQHGGASAMRVMHARADDIHDSALQQAYLRSLDALRERLGDAAHGGLSLSEAGPVGALSVAAPEGSLTMDEG